MVERVKFKGRQGDWTADVVEWAERLPCVHKCFWVTDRDYHDPHPSQGDQRFAPYIALMREKRRVIATKSKLDPSKPRGGGEFKRDGYVGVFEVANITVDDDGLRFRFGECLARSK